MGVSPATGPTPNKGFEAAGMQKLGMVLKQLTDILPMVGANSEVGQEVLKILTKLSKHVPAGAVSPASEKNNLEQMLLNNQRSQGQLAQLKQAMMAGGAAGGVPGGAPGGMPAQMPPGGGMMPRAA